MEYSRYDCISCNWLVFNMNSEQVFEDCFNVARLVDSQQRIMKMGNVELKDLLHNFSGKYGNDKDSISENEHLMAYLAMIELGRRE